MAFSLSPSVNVTEIDLTGIIPAVSTTDGALVGKFHWGPAMQIVEVNTENELVGQFGRPSLSNAPTWFTAASFLAYGNLLRLVRVVNSDAKNAHQDTLINVLIKNDDEFDAFTVPLGLEDFAVAKHPGALGDGIKVSVCPSGGRSFFESEILGFSTDGVDDTIIAVPNAGAGVDNANLYAAPGSVLIKESTGERRTIVAVLNAGQIQIESPFAVDLVVTDPMTLQWEYFESVGLPPSTSLYAQQLGGSGDEVHVVVVDSDGHLTGLPGQVIERYQFLSKIAEAKKEDGATSYWKEVVSRVSRYVRILQNPATGDWTSNDPAHTFVQSPPSSEVFAGGSDGTGPTDGNIIQGYDLFRNVELVDISLVLLANHSSNVARYVINNICEFRMDCVAFISPNIDSVVNADPNNLPKNVIDDRKDLEISTSYAVMDCNWKYMYDKYNDVYRWVPLNGDIAGLCVRTDNQRDPWWSPAGLNRGQIKNVVKLAYNPIKPDRDQLYLNGVNPVVSFPAQGIVLFGDKTLLAKPSAFDRINVRRLFIVLEKAIATAAKYFLFEFNDTFTRSQFKNMVDPYLARVQAARGIFDYRVVCDETNNTPEIIDSNQFVGDIYIKPARSINFIQLNFIATRTGAEFSEIVGKF